MDTRHPIHDLYIRNLKSIDEANGFRIPVLSFDDHLLRRFAYAEMVFIQPSPPDSMQVRQVADEIWALIDGKVRFIWHDLRTTSPTKDQRFEMVAYEPTLVLVPFGVAFTVQALESDAQLLRLTSHMPGSHEGDRTIPWKGQE